LRLWVAVTAITSVRRTVRADGVRPKTDRDGGHQCCSDHGSLGGSKKRRWQQSFAIGVPCDGASHFMLDIALSVSSRGRIRGMAQTNQRIPEGWAVDAQGNPTTDPLEALKGFVLPIGGHKGYGLALAIDMMAGVLTGAGFGGGVKSMLQQGNEAQHVGHFMLVIDRYDSCPGSVSRDASTSCVIQCGRHRHSIPSGLS
jgi:LDH2 family malate/lactate/ureidoglycolate dehydrogenase